MCKYQIAYDLFVFLKGRKHLYINIYIAAPILSQIYPVHNFRDPFQY